MFAGEYCLQMNIVCWRILVVQEDIVCRWILFANEYCMLENIACTGRYCLQMNIVCWSILLVQEDIVCRWILFPILRPTLTHFSLLSTWEYIGHLPAHILHSVHTKVFPPTSFHRKDFQTFKWHLCHKSSICFSTQTSITRYQIVLAIFEKNKKIIDRSCWLIWLKCMKQSTKGSDLPSGKSLPPSYWRSNEGVNEWLSIYNSTVDSCQAFIAAI